MAKYTISLYSIESAETFKLFDENYDFYLEENKENFQKKFYNRYYDREIFCKNPRVFKRELIGKLNEIAPYYKQLYKTELESQNINFLLNKDLKEEFTRELDNQSNSNSTSNSNSSGTSQNIFSDTPEGNINNLDKYMSNASKSKADDESTSNSNSQNTTKGKEKTTLLSQGNIGITSSAELLEKWRSVLINIDSMILDELSYLFLDIY